MMANWRRWIRPGLVLTFLLAILAVTLRSGVVERELGERVASRLSNDGQNWAQVEISGRSATIVGTAPSTEAQVAAAESVRRVPGILAVSDGSDLLPVASPYVWSARKIGSVLTLAGSIPSEGLRTSLLAATRRAMPEAQIHDEMQLARGAPAAFNSGTAFVLDRLKYFSDASVTITDSTLSVSGVAADASQFSAAQDAFHEDVPAQIALGPIDVLPARADRFVWSAKRDGTSLTLSGYVPNDIVRQSLRESVEQSFPGAAIVDNMQIASGAPDGFIDATGFALAALTRLEEGDVALDGMLLDISGKAKSVADYESIAAAFLNGMPRGMQVVASEITPATVTSYGWRGEREDGEVRLIGYVPSPAAKSAVMAAADELFSDDNVVDQIRIAAGEPRMDWIGAIKFAMGQLARLERGSVVLDEKSFSIEGEAASPEAYTDLLAANTQTLPSSLELAASDVQPPVASPYRFAVARTPSSIALDGYVTSETEHEAIISAVKGKFGRVELADNLVYASGAPENFIQAATVAVHAVSRLAGGHSEISDSAVNIVGAAYYPAAAGSVVDALADSMPQDYDVAVSIMVRQPGQPVEPLRCRDRLQEILSVGRIEFDGGEAEVSNDSYGILDRVAATLGRCPTATIEVGAHTDSDGSTANNLALSQSRAEAIVEFLVDAGVKRERLNAVGFGEEKPVADNSTAEGKAANRRIEFVLEVPERG
jgi:OmpA-OmpF porin, OOP family